MLDSLCRFCRSQPRYAWPNSGPALRPARHVQLAPPGAAAGSLAMIVALVLCGGCQPGLFGLRPPQAAADTASSGHERLRRAYADLASGRFHVLADLNSPRQADAFRLLSADGHSEDREQPAISREVIRHETGGGALRFVLTALGDTLELDGASAAMPGDWQPYTLLLASLHAPTDGLLMELAIRSGPDGGLEFTRRFELQSGWNLLRLDLADAEESADLTDVRSLRWRLVAGRTPVELHLDDLLLTDNTRRVCGDPAREDELYVLERGRRIYVGAGGRFELGFSGGALVCWRVAGGTNLTVPTGLGPWPVPLATDWAVRAAEPVAYDEAALWEGWGEKVATFQELVEASALRVVLRGTWRFGAPPGRLPDDAPAVPRHEWQYVIYSSGEVFASVRSHSAGRGWSAPRVGYALAVDGRHGFSRALHAPDYGEPDAVRYLLLAQRGEQRPDLLWVPHDPRLASRRLELVSADERRIACLLGDVEASESVESAHLLRIWPTDLERDSAAEMLAADYQQPARLEVQRGRLVTDASGDFDRDGFNESEGCYELELGADTLRVRFEPGRWNRHEPLLRVRGTAGRRCWVYADGRIVGQTGRDAHGALLIRLPLLISQPVAIEVVTRR